MSFLNTVFLGNSILEYIHSVVIFVLLLVVLRILRKVLARKISEFTKKTKNIFDDFLVNFVEKNRPFFYTYLSFFISIQFLEIPDFYDKIFYHVFIIFAVFEIVLSLQSAIGFFLENVVKDKEDKSAKKAFEAIGKFAGWILWGLAILFIISNFGVDVTALLTGLGIGGIAIAFALKSVLTDLFSYITILLDKPVEEGDYITVDGNSGSVKSIGVKTTRLVAPDGQEVVVSNDKISSGILDNFGKREYRRKNFDIRFSLNTPTEKIKKAKEEIERIITSIENTEFLRAYFKNISPDALIISVDYKAFPESYSQYCAMVEQINIEILSSLEKEGIELAYPTQHVIQEDK